MRLIVAWTGKTKEAPIAALTAEYLKRIGRYIEVDAREFKSESALREWAARERIRPTLVLLDEHGRQFTSPEFAQFISRHQETGTQALAFAIGPADGFTNAARAGAAHVISLGKMVLAHELARVVLLEQIYRAFTILAGHPYHRE